MTSTAAGLSTALLTDHYELTMIAAALKDGTADRPSVFEAFARRLPDGRRYGVVGGTGRLIEAIERFRFDDDQLFYLRSRGIREEDATRLIIRGFFNEVLNQIPVESVREELISRVAGELERNEN